MNADTLAKRALDAATPNGALIRELKKTLARDCSDDLRAALQAVLDACEAGDEHEIDRTLDRLLENYKPPDNWREMMIADIQAGTLQFEDLAEWFDADFAREAFAEAGAAPDGR
mgnify:CR=1 FL=1